MAFIELILGFVFLIAGGEALLRGAVAIARRFGLSPLLIGLTLVGFGTSSPELLTSVQAALVGSPGLAVGNVVGSNIANILLILGTTALIFPLATSPAAFRRDGAATLAATLICIVAVLAGEIDRLWGLGLLLVLASYVSFTYLKERGTPDASAAVHEAEASVVSRHPSNLWLSVAFTVGGFGLTLLGAKTLVSGAITIAQSLGMSEAVVGLTIVAFGTSLPELVTSIVAALKRETDVAFGNIIGSSLFNVLGILGVTALVSPITVPPEIATLDIWVMLAATILMIVFAVTGWRLSRVEGAVFLTGYVGYVGYLVAGV